MKDGTNLPAAIYRRTPPLRETAARPVPTLEGEGCGR